MNQSEFHQERRELQRTLSRRDLLRRGGLGVGVLLVPGALTGCGPGDAPEGTTETTPGSEAGPDSAGRGRQGGTLVYGVNAITGNSDPAIFATFGDWMAIDCIARGLTHIDYRTTEPQPALAESWEISEDRLTYTFTLREGLTFHDGNPVTANDCERSFGRLMDEDDPSRPPGTYTIAELGGDNILEARAVDDRTFELVLAQPDEAFLARLSNPNGVILSAAAIDEHGADIGNSLVGAGPFRFVSATPDSEVQLEAFEDYWEGRPPLDRVVLQVLPDPAALTSALSSGSVQMSNFAPHASVPQFEANDQLVVQEPKPYIDVFLLMNAGVPLLADLRVRQAINYALDRQAVVQQAFVGVAQEPAYMIAPPELGYDASLSTFSTQDMDRAKSLLEEAGAAGERVSLLVENILFWPKVGQIVEANLRELGLDPQVELVDSATFSSRFFDPDAHELGTWQRSAFVPDPDNKLSPLLQSGSFVTEVGTQNHLLDTQERLDQLLDEARAEGDQDRRAQLYLELQEFLADEVMVYSMLSYIYTPVVSAADLTGTNADALGTYRLFLEQAAFTN